MKAIIIFSVALTILASVNSQSIDTLLHNKLASATPGIDANQYAQFASQIGYWGTRLVQSIDKSQLASIAHQVVPISVGGSNHNIQPYMDAMALKWGDKLEHLETKQFISGVGGWSWGIVTGTIGTRVGDHVEIRSITGWTQSVTNQQYQTISFQSCKRKLFKKKCHTEHRQEPRGLTQGEVDVISSGIVNNSFLGALQHAP
jgi:hypothetical protein